MPGSADHPDQSNLGEAVPVEPVIRRGEAVVAGKRHHMRVAKPSSATARLYGLNPNHHVRVWCSCQYDGERQHVDVEAVEATGVLPSAIADTRGLGAFDWLGIADMRIPGSALDVFRAHLREVARCN